MALPSYKEIVDLLKKGATVEAQEKIMELRETVLELQEENHSLKEKVRDLEEHLKIKGELKFDGSVYWKVVGDNRDGPFCQRCYDADHKLIRLQSSTGDWWNCFNCKAAHRKSGANIPRRGGTV